MNDRSARVLLNRITSRIESGDRGIDGETYAQFFEMLSEVIAGDADTPPDLADLERLVYAAKAYDRADGLPGFDVGALWGSIGTLEAVRDLKGAAEEERRCKLLIEKHWALFAAVAAHPDITQSELADALGTSRSNLSQILARIEPYRLLQANPVGRSKHYRLTRYARSLFDEMSDRRDEKEACNGSTEPHVLEFGKVGTEERHSGKPNAPTECSDASFERKAGGRKDHEATSAYGEGMRPFVITAKDCSNSNSLCGVG